MQSRRHRWGRWHASGLPANGRTRAHTMLGGAGIAVCGMAPLRGAESLSQTLSLLRPTHTKVSSAHKILRDYYTIKYNLSTYLLRSSPRVRESSGFSYLISHSHATNSYSYSAGLPVVTLHSSFRLIRRHSVDAPVHVFIDIITFELQYFPALIRSATHMRRSPDSVVLP